MRSKNVSTNRDKLSSRISIFRGWKYHININFEWPNSGYPSPRFFVLWKGPILVSFLEANGTLQLDTWQHPISIGKNPVVFLPGYVLNCVAWSLPNRDDKHLLVTAGPSRVRRHPATGRLSCDGTGSKDSDCCNIEKAWLVRSNTRLLGMVNRWIRRSSNKGWLRTGVPTWWLMCAYQDTWVPN